MKRMMMCLFLCCVSASGFANEQDKNKTSLEAMMADAVIVSDAWARATFALAKSGAGYMYISNESTQTITLTDVKVSEALAADAQLHHTVMQDDMMQMRELSEGLSIDGGQTISFRPGGMHIMIMGLMEPLEPSQTFPLTLIFSDGSEKTAKVLVKDARFNKSMSLEEFSKGAKVANTFTTKGIKHE